jgi:hypothetical protein
LALRKRGRVGRGEHPHETRDDHGQAHDQPVPDQDVRRDGREARHDRRELEADRHEHDRVDRPDEDLPRAAAQQSRIRGQDASRSATGDQAGDDRGKHA